MVECAAMRREEFEKDDKPQDASKLRVGIVMADFNRDITENMLAGAQKVFKDWHVPKASVHIAHVHGSFELPIVCQKLIRRHKLHAIVALGCIVKGETRHDEFLAQATMHGLVQLGLAERVPIGLGVLTTETIAQARARAGDKVNHGAKAAVAALRAALA